MNKSTTYSSYQEFINSENNKISELIHNYTHYKENMTILNNKFEESKLKYLTQDELLYNIQQTEKFLLNDTESPKYTETWLFIYQDELLRRRREKINKIKKNLYI